MTEATSVVPEDPRMAITLGKRKRSRRDPAPARSLDIREGPGGSARSLDDIAQAERAAMTVLTETLGRLAAELPEDSLLAAEFASVARSIDVAGVLGTWRLNGLVREPGERTE
jgi:hypothetical protein